ncbi:MAG: AAA family ATPase [Anaerolineae bacterium]
MAVVTLSRQMGSGGEEIARRVAEALGLQVVDRTRLQQAAEEAGVPRVAFEELTYEGQRTLVEEMLRILQAMPAIPVAPQASRQEVIGPFRLPFGGAFASPIPPVSSIAEAMERYLEIVGMVVRDLAAAGDILFLGQGGQAILRDHPGVLHVLVVADFQDRVAAVAEELELTHREAERRVRANDRARADFLRRHYHLDWLAPQNYHLVLNTSLLGREAAVQVVVAAARAVATPTRAKVQEER